MESYGLPLAVMVRSLLEHLAAGRAVRIVVIDGRESRPRRSGRLAESWQDTEAACRCEVEYVIPTMAERMTSPAWGRVTR